MTKPTNWHVGPAKTLIRLGICPVWSVFAVRMKKARVLSYPLSAQWRLWSDWADAQADLSLRWAHSHFVGFVMKRLKCSCTRGMQEKETTMVFGAKFENWVYQDNCSASLGKYCDAKQLTSWQTFKSHLKTIKDQLHTQGKRNDRKKGRDR